MEDENNQVLTTVDHATKIGDFSLSDATISIKTEHRDDRAARLKQEELEAQASRFREKWRFIVFLGMYVVIFVVSLGLSLLSHDVSTVHWAKTVFVGCVTGVGGFLIR